MSSGSSYWGFGGALGSLLGSENGRSPLDTLGGLHLKGRVLQVKSKGLCFWGGRTN